MSAILYADTGTVRELLEADADPHVKNDAGATALMWAAGEPDKARRTRPRQSSCFSSAART